MNVTVVLQGLVVVRPYKHFSSQIFQSAGIVANYSVFWRHALLLATFIDN